MSANHGHSEPIPNIVKFVLVIIVIAILFEFFSGSSTFFGTIDLAKRSESNNTAIQE